MRAVGESTKHYFEGTHRTLAPTQTLARLRPLLPKLGITRVANVTGLDRIGIPVVTVCRPNSRSLAVFQGKGLSLEAAKVSGIMEALEVWHAERVMRPLKLASAEEMRGHHRIADLSALPRLAGATIDLRARMLWIEATDLQGSGAVWVPYELVSMDYRRPLPSGSGAFQASSNGLASGNHWLEAVNHALCEVVERDARTLWQLSSTLTKAQRMVDLDSVTEPQCKNIIQKIREKDLDLRAWDVTSNIGIATFVCQVLDPADTGASAEVGSGAHPAREIALLRALTEAVQARATYITGSRDDFFPAHYGESARKERAGDMLFRSEAARELRPYEEVPDYRSNCLEDDLHWTLVRLRAAGFDQALAVDLTQEAIGVPVVRVLLPGLEGPTMYADADHAPGARARRFCKVL
jgi:ribosomal protein S12 methylthiotransferase accessory factor